MKLGQLIKNNVEIFLLKNNGKNHAGRLVTGLLFAFMKTSISGQSKWVTP